MFAARLLWFVESGQDILDVSYYSIVVTPERFLRDDQVAYLSLVEIQYPEDYFDEPPPLISAPVTPIASARVPLLRYRGLFYDIVLCFSILFFNFVLYSDLTVLNP